MINQIIFFQALLFASALFILLISFFKIIKTRKIIINMGLIHLSAFLFILSITLSIALNSPNRIQAVLNPNFGLLSILSLNIIYFYLRSGGKLIKRIAAVISIILAIIIILFYLKNPSFSLSPLSYSWKAALEIFRNPLNSFFGFGVDNYSSVFNKVKDLSYNQSGLWQINSFDVSRSAILHILTETGLFGLISFLLLFIFAMLEKRGYLFQAFQRADEFGGKFFKARNTVSRFFLLHKKSEDMCFEQVTEGKTASDAVSVREKRHIELFFFIIITFLTFVFLFFPPSLLLFSLLFLFFGATPNVIPLQTEQSGVFEINLKRSPLFYFIPFLLLIFITTSSYLLTRTYLAEYYFKKSLDALTKNNVNDLYNKQRHAILTNPYIERFRITFSQTNLLIANSLATKAKTDNTSEVNVVQKNTSEVKKTLAAQDRQTITQAIQAAIEEAKAAVTLNPQKAANWENLAQVYSSFLNTAKGADFWTISAYQRAILLDPQNPQYRLSLGGTYYLLKNYNEATKKLEEAVTLKPDWPNAHYNLAWALFQKKDYQKAISEMQTVLNLLDKEKDKTDYNKAKKELDKFKLKLSEENSP